MNELRVILLIAGILLIVGMYIWGMRSRTRSGGAADPTSRRAAVFTGTADSFEKESPQADESSPAVVDTRRIEPSLSTHDSIESQHAPGRREPTWSNVDEAADLQAEPRPSARPGDNRIEPSYETRPEADHEEVHEPLPQETVAKPQRPPQKIIALRVNAVAPSRLDGTRLRDAILAEDLAFGRYDIFHRKHTDGRPIFSVASLREPGTFDLGAMPTTQYPGIALFVVLPGPVAAAEAMDEMVFTARALAAQLGAGLADERGVPLTPLRLGRLREEALEFERGTGTA